MNKVDHDTYVSPRAEVIEIRAQAVIGTPPSGVKQFVIESSELSS